MDKNVIASEQLIVNPFAHTRAKSNEKRDPKNRWFLGLIIKKRIFNRNKLNLLCEKSLIVFIYTSLLFLSYIYISE